MQEFDYIAALSVRASIRKTAPRSARLCRACWDDELSCDCDETVQHALLQKHQQSGIDEKSVTQQDTQHE